MPDAYAVVLPPETAIETPTIGKRIEVRMSSGQASMDKAEGAM